MVSNLPIKTLVARQQQTSYIYTDIDFRIILTVLLVKEVIVNDTNERIALIEDEAAGISFPREVLTGIVVGRERVRVASLLFRNMSGLLPERLEEDDNG